MNITTNAGGVIIPFDTEIIDLDQGYVYYVDEYQPFFDEVTLYPTGHIVHFDQFEDDEYAVSDFNLYDESGELIVDKSVDHLDHIGIRPVKMSLKKFLKKIDPTHKKFLYQTLSNITEETPICQYNPCSMCSSSPDDEQHKEKPDVVKVVRYLRKYKMNASGELVVDNMSGMTIVAELNYAEKVVCVHWSDCTNDNFCKETGYETALCNGSLLKFRMPYGIPECGLVSYLGNECEKELYDRTLKGLNHYDVVHKFFSHFTKYLHKEEN